MTIGEIEAVLKLRDEMSANLVKAEGNLKNFGTSATNIGKVMSVALTAPLLAIGGFALKAAIDFESSFAGVGKTVDGVMDKFGQLTPMGAELAQSFRDLAKEIPVSVNELSKIGEAAGQLGIKKDDILGFTRTMADLGATTNLTSDQAATSIAQIQNSFGAGGVDVDRFGATLVALGNAGASTERDIVEMAKRIAGAGNQVGLSQGQVLAFASSLSSVGINAEAGGSAISRTFLRINDAVMGGGAKLAEFARIAGVSAAEFKASFQTDAAGATTAFIAGLGRIKGEGENVSKTLEGVGIKSIIMKDTLLRASGAGELLGKDLALASKAWQENSALADEATKRYATTESQLIKLKNEINDAGITLGKALIPMLRDMLGALRPVIGFIGDLAKGFSELPDPAKNAAVAILAGFAVTGPIVLGLGATARAVTSVREALLLLQGMAAFKALTAGGAVLGGTGVVTSGLLGAGAIGYTVTEVARLNAEWERLATQSSVVAGAEDKKGTALLTVAAAAKKAAEAAKGVTDEWTAQLPVSAANKKAADDAAAAAARLTTVTDEQKKAIAAYAKEVQGLRDQLSGAALQGDLKKLEDAWKGLRPAQKANEETIKRTVEAYRDLRDDGANSELLNNLSELYRLIQLLDREFESLAPNIGKVTLPLAKFRIETDGAVVGGQDLNKTLGVEMDGAMRRATVASDAATAQMAAFRAGVFDAKEETSDYAKRTAEAFQAAGQLIGQFADESSAAMAATVALSAAASFAAKDYASGLMAIFSAGFAYMDQLAAEENARQARSAAARATMLQIRNDMLDLYGRLSDIDDLGKILGVDLAKALEPLNHPNRQQALLFDAEALKALSEAYAAAINKLFEAVDDNAGLASAQLQQVINQLDKVAESAKIANDFIRAAAQQAGGGLNDLIGGLSESDAAKQRQLIEEQFSAEKAAVDERIAGRIAEIDSLKSANDQRVKAMEDAIKADQRLLRDATGAERDAIQDRIQARQDELNEFKDRSAAWLAERQRDLDLDKKALAERTAAFEKESGAVIGVFVRTQEQARGLASAVVGAFGEMLARGVPLREALEAMQPSIDRMREQLVAAGFDGGAAFGALTEMSRIANDAIMGPLVDAIGGARNALTGLHNSQLLNQESFGAIAQSATQAYEAILAQGGDGSAALAMMQPTLQTIWKLQQDFGYEVDAATQALLDQAVAAGIVGAQRLTDEQRQTAAAERTATVLGELLAFFQRLLPASEDVGKEVTDAMKAGGAAVDGVTKSTGQASSGFAAMEDAADLLQDGFDRADYATPFDEGTEAVVRMRRELDDLIRTMSQIPGGVGGGTSAGMAGFAATAAMRSDTRVAAGALGGLVTDGLRPGSLASAQAPIRIPVYLDGRQIAEAVYDGLPNVLQSRGVL